MRDEDYWHADELLSRNAMFNFAIGGRGTGKTFDCVRRCIRRAQQSYAKVGIADQFIYVRRYKSEFADRQLFFSAVSQKFPGWEFKVEGWNGYMRKCVKEGAKENRWIHVCYLVTLANALTKKSVPYPHVKWIIYDEFIIDKGSLHYLQNECKAFLDFYNTVDRFEDRVRVLFIANAVSIVNPYFVFFDLKPRKGQRFLKAKDGYICVESVEATAYVEHVNSTRFGKMIRGTSYYDYAVGNEYHDDNDMFIERKTDTAQFHYAIRFDSRTIGVWVDYVNGVYYVCARYPKDAQVYTLTKEDMAPNLLMVERSSAMLKGLRKLYMAGCVRFDDVRSRALFNDIMEYLGL